MVPICESTVLMRSIFRRTKRMRQPAGAGKSLDVLLRRLGMALVTERQGVVHEDFGRMRCTFRSIARR